MSRQSNIDSFMWLLVITALSSAMYKESVKQKEIQNVWFDKNYITKILNVSVKACAKGIRNISYDTICIRIKRRIHQGKSLLSKL